MINKLKKNLGNNIAFLIFLAFVGVCGVFLAIGTPSEDGSITLDGKNAKIDQSTLDFIEDSQAALARLMNQDAPTDEQTIAARDSRGSKIKTYYNKRGQLKTGTFYVDNVQYKAATNGRIYSVKNLAKVICQRPELPTGCEITSWTMMANYAGVKIDKLRAADLMPRSSDPNQGFVGDPHSFGGGSLVIYPGGLAQMTQKYLRSYTNMTGCSMEKLQDKLWKKHLVLIWVTRLDGFGSHTVALTGYDQKNFFYNDPWTGAKEQIDRDELRVIWTENGCRAMSY